MSYVNHGSAGGLVRKLQGSKRVGRREIYMILAEVKRINTFWRGDEAKFLDFMITNKCGMDFGDLDCNQLKVEVDLDF
jgi:hypothetical protein